MKKMKLVLSLFVAVIAMSVQGQTQIDVETAPIMTFEKTVYDWGTLKEGEKTETDFKFTNTGKTDLIITRIKGSCGCTVPSNWKKEPIKPGETSSFHVTFNSRNKPNRQQKTVTVSCNTAKGKERVKSNVIRIHHYLSDGKTVNIYIDVKTPHKDYDYAKLMIWNANSSKTILIDNITIENYE